MINDALLGSKPSTPALLSLSRFVRGTLRQVGIGLASLVVVLNVAGHASVADTFESHETLSGASLPAFSLQVSASEPKANILPARALADLSSVPVAAQLPLTPPAPHPRPRRLLSPTLTSHRLTSARLSMPPQTRAVVSMAESP